MPDDLTFKIMQQGLDAVYNAIGGNILERQQRNKAALELIKSDVDNTCANYTGICPECNLPTEKSDFFRVCRMGITKKLCNVCYGKWQEYREEFQEI